jgi:hypothetical protein
MSDTLEERVRRLEAFSYRALGLLNAQNTILSDRWCNVIANADPQNVLATLDRLRDQWLGDADKPPYLPGIDPVHLDVVSQEYRDALELLVVVMRQKLQAAPTSGHPKKDG